MRSQFISACFVSGITCVEVSGDTVVVDGNGQLGTAAVNEGVAQTAQQSRGTTGNHYRVEGNDCAATERYRRFDSATQRPSVRNSEGERTARRSDSVHGGLEVSKHSPQTILNHQ